MGRPGAPSGCLLGDKRWGRTRWIKAHGEGRAVGERRWAAHVSQVLSAEPLGLVY